MAVTRTRTLRSSNASKPEPISDEIKPKANAKVKKLSGNLAMTPDKKPKSASKRAVEIKAEASSPLNSRKRKRADVKTEKEDQDDMPHNLGSLPDDVPVKSEKKAKKQTAMKPETPAKKTGAKRTPGSKSKSVKSEADEDIATPSKRGKKAKDTTYGIMFGVSPWPTYTRPTPEECMEVNNVLSKLHGKVSPPKQLPAPSDVVSGCGEVPSVLDAIIRTRLSANTTNTNSGRAMKGLIDTFGKMTTGIGKGSCDWNAVRLAPQKKVYEAIKSGGMADKKSKDIQAILNIVYTENQARRKALLEGDGSVPGTEKASAEEKQAERAAAEDDFLSLNHLHLLADAEIAERLRSLPGIGVKTASCVMLFSMHRPSFAVDTHVFRLVQWLGWIPDVDWVASQGQKLKKPDRDTAFAHLDVRIPNELKYALHYLLIKHGKTCPRCRAITSSTSKGWEEGCGIEHLLKRTGGRKGEAGASPVKTPSKKRAMRETPELSPSVSMAEATEEELDEMSDLGSIDEPSEEESEMEDDE